MQREKRGRIRNRPPVDTSLPIERRIIDAVAWMVHVRRWNPHVMYLTPEDMAKLEPRYRGEVGGIRVRLGKKNYSMLYADCYYGIRI